MSTAKWRIDGFVKVNHPHARLIEAAREALDDDMTDPNDEIPDARPWSALIRHLASLMENKALLSHMAKDSSTSGAGWAKLLYAKADQIDAALSLLGKAVK